MWNPLEPAGDYVLDLGKHETREVARMLTALEYGGAAPKRAPQLYEVSAQILGNARHNYEEARAVIFEPHAAVSKHNRIVSKHDRPRTVQS